MQALSFNTTSAAAFALATLMTILIALLVALSILGLGPGVLNAPTAGMAFFQQSWLPGIIAMLYVALGINLAVLLGNLSAVASTKPTLARLISMCAVAAGTLFVGYGMIDLVAQPYAIEAFALDPAIGSGAYVAIRAVGHALSAAALAITGAGILMIGIASIRRGEWPMLLSWLMIVAGAAYAVSFVVLALGLIGLLLTPIWAVWVASLSWADRPASNRDHG
ncbi:MAG: hypothetical protein WBA73_07305 [Devosia sp.]